MDNNDVADTTAIHSIQLFTKQQLADAAMIVITTCGGAACEGDYAIALSKYIHNGCLIAFVRPGESIHMISEKELNQMGWTRKTS